jgi:hypothetical protein
LEGGGRAVRTGAARQRVEVGATGGARWRWRNSAALGGGGVLPEAAPRSVGDGERENVLLYLDVLWGGVVPAPANLRGVGSGRLEGTPEVWAAGVGRRLAGSAQHAGGAGEVGGWD